MRSRTASRKMALVCHMRTLSALGSAATCSTSSIVEKRHAALDRRRHAHLILLHQQLVQIGLKVSSAHPIEDAALVRPDNTASARRTDLAASSMLGTRQELALKPFGVHGEVLEKQAPNAGIEREEGALADTAEARRQRLNHCDAPGPAAARASPPSTASPTARSTSSRDSGCSRGTARRPLRR